MAPWNGPNYIDEKAVSEWKAGRFDSLIDLMPYADRQACLIGWLSECLSDGSVTTSAWNS